ncbi:MAG: ABC transporter ATP-binding protein [Clostridiales bacterium]|nr:ABC transporter ATP-binding protein [Clostridiales bacterium]
MNDITVTKLNKGYGGKPVLRDLSMKFEAGRVTNIMGPSGCGKTTLLNIMMGLEKADCGSVHGIPKRIAAVFQEYRLCEEFSPVSNIRMVTGKTIPRSGIERHLRELGLGDSMYKPVRELSGGMKQRVSIARAVLHNADLIFLDEAYKGLDADTLSAVIKFVLDNSEGKTIIHVTHDLQTAALMGGCVIKMESVRYDAGEIKD